MQVITDKELYRKIWDKVFIDYSFSPSIDGPRMWLRPKGTFQTYKLGQIWEEEQEAIVNAILGEVIGEEMYALDWQHDCFLFDPNERIPPGFRYYDSQRACNVFFPEYYPDGDYHFFISKDWSSGLYGHPWRKELIVVGDELIAAVEKNCFELNIKRL